MPNPYANTGVVDQRDAITKALMNVAAPPPTSQQPQMPQGRPLMSLPQMPPPGAPPQGAPTPVSGPLSMPLTGGVPPQQPPMNMGTGTMGAPMGQSPYGQQQPMSSPMPNPVAQGVR